MMFEVFNNLYSVLYSAVYKSLILCLNMRAMLIFLYERVYRLFSFKLILSMTSNEFLTQIFIYQISYLINNSMCLNEKHSIMPKKELRLKTRTNVVQKNICQGFKMLSF